MTDDRAHIRCDKCGIIYRVPREKAILGRSIRARCKCGNVVTGELYDCPKCGARQLKGEECIVCGVFFPKAKRQASAEASPTPPHHSSLSPAIRNRPPRPFYLSGIIGCFLLAIGSFTPIFRAPITGSINYFRNGEGDGAVMLVLAFGAILFIIVRSSPWFVRILGVISAVIISYDFFSLMNRLHSANASLHHQLAGNPFRGLAEGMARSAQIEWGWIVLYCGALLLILYGVIDKTPRTPSENR